MDGQVYWLTTRAAASLLRVSVRTLARMRRDGQLVEGRDYVWWGRGVLRYRRTALEKGQEE